MSAMTLPVSVKSTWATKTSSPSADGIGESQVTTLMPLACAALAAGTIWSPELLEIMIASTPWVVALVTISIWPATLFSGVGPRYCSSIGFFSSFCRLEGPLVGLVEGQDAEELRQQHHLHRPCRAPAPACARCARRAASPASPARRTPADIFFMCPSPSISRGLSAPCSVAALTGSARPRSRSSGCCR